jgi:hypothetical protein
MMQSVLYAMAYCTNSGSWSCTPWRGRAARSANGHRSPAIKSSRALILESVMGLSQ